MKARLTFGVDDAPIDPTLCVRPVRERWDDVLTETLCLHRKKEHHDDVGEHWCEGTVDWPGGDRGTCPCNGFRSAVRP